MANCINTNHQDFKKLLNKTGFSEALLAAKISNWQKVNGLDNYPTAKDLGVSKTPASSELDNKVVEFLDAIGVNVELISDDNDFVAVSKILENVIQVVNGKADITTLPEEAGHMFVRFMGINSPLVQRMLAQIEGLDIYQKVLAEYGSNPEYQYSDGSINYEKIKEEAVGKLISQHIVETYQKLKSGDVVKTANWFERFMNMLKVLINKTLKTLGINSFEKLINSAEGKYSINPFEESAQRILKKDIRGLSEKNVGNASNMYQQTSDGIAEAYKESQKRITLVNEKKDNATIHEYIQDQGTTNEKKFDVTATTISQEQTKYKNKFNNVDTSQWDKYRVQGTRIHEFAQDIVNNYINGTTSAMHSKFTSLTEKAIYEKIRTGLINQLDLYKLQYPGSKFLSEVMLIDPTYQGSDIGGKKYTGVAGSIDLLIIHPDGTASIFDYKTFKATKDTYDNFKFLEYSRQIAIYKKLLLKGNKDLGIPGVKGIKHSRIVPIAVSRNTDGSMIDVDMKQLTPISLEETGNTELDDKINNLYKRYDDLMQLKKYSDPIKEQRRQGSIAILRNSIIKLQTEKNYNTVVDDALNEMKIVSNILNQETITNEELEEMSQILTSYEDVAGLIDKSKMTAEQIYKFEMLAGNILLYKKDIDKIAHLMSNETLKDLGIKNEGNLQKKTGFFNKWFASMSQQNHPILAALHKLITNVLNKNEMEFNSLRKELTEQKDKLDAYAKSKGITIQNVFDKLINKKKGNLVNKFSQEYWDARNKARSEGDTKWLLENLELDKPRYEAYKKRTVDAINSTVYDVTSPEKNEFIRRRRIADLESTHTNLVTSWFAKIKDSKLEQFYSSEFKAIRDDKELLNFYNFYTSITERYAKFLPNFEYKEHFIPNVYKTSIEELIDLGPNALSNVKDRAKKMFSLSKNEDQSLGAFNPLTGEVEYKTPTFYLNSLDPNVKSYDLLKVLQLYGEMAINYKNMSEIEGTTDVLLKDLKNSSLKGKENRTTTEILKEKGGVEDYVQMFEYYRNYFVYGIKDTINSNLTQVIKAGNTFAAVNILAFSPFPAIAAVTGNLMNTSVMAARNKYYNTKLFGQAMIDLAGGKHKEVAYALIDLIAPQIDNRNAEHNRRLSGKFVVKHFSMEQLFVMLRKPDEWFQASNFTAMTKTYTLTEDNKVVLIDKLLGKPDNYYSLTEEERKTIDSQMKDKRKTIKSLQEQVTIVDGVLKINGRDVDNNMMKGLLEFRQTVRQVAKSVIGNMDANDLIKAKENAYFRALMLFRNWLPRMVYERFGEKRYNRDLGEYEWGRYSTVFNFLKNHIVNTKNKLEFNLLAGVENVAKAEYLKYVAENTLNGKPIIDYFMTETEFVDMYKSNMKASYRGMVLTSLFLSLLLMIRLGAAPDPDDPEGVQTGTEKALLKALNRATAESLMYINPIEALSIIKSPTATIAPMVNLFSAMNQTTKQFIGWSLNDEKMMKKATPLGNWLSMLPSSGIDRFMRLYDKAYGDYLNDVNQDE